MRDLETNTYYEILVEPAEDILPELLGALNVPSVSSAPSAPANDVVQPQRLQSQRVSGLSNAAAPVGQRREQALRSNIQSARQQIGIKSGRDTLAEQQTEPLHSYRPSVPQSRMRISLFVALAALLLLGIVGGVGFGYLLSVSQNASALSHTTFSVIAHLPTLSLF